MTDKQRTQVVVLHGGMTFDSYDDYLSFLKTREVDIDTFRAKTDWKASLGVRLGEDFDVFTPRMPNGTGAHYVEWKIWFERLLSVVNDNSIFVGHSLGGIFLAKYFSENDVLKKIKATILVAAPFDGAGSDESLGDFILSASLKKFADQGGSIYVFQSKDDPYVPPEQAGKYQVRLPHARVMMFEDRAHFNMEEFPELVSLIRSL
jgi:predicted alpha/beta hydrolase family esterase